MNRKVALLGLMLMLMFGLLYSEQLTLGSKELNEVYGQISGSSEKISVYIMMKERIDSDRLYNEVVHLNKNERRERTINTLRDFSDRTQANLRKEIEILKKEGEVVDVSYLWITNIIGMKASAEALRRIDNHPDIEVIEYDPLVNMIDDYYFVPDEEEEIESFDVAYNNQQTPNKETRRNDKRDQFDAKTREITYNVTKVKAPDVWEAGYKGEGIIVAVLDTGVNYNHHDIRNRMWNHPEYPHHGYNFIENNFETMDLHSHGTHCAGTVAGDGTSGSQSGVAPDAQIMALKTLSDEGSGNANSNTQGYQFAVQYGASVLSCSFGSMGAHANTRRVHREAMNAVLSAGVIASISAGNHGDKQEEHPIPRNIGSPSDCPPPWLHPDQTLRSGISAVISVGATDANDRITDFSSRGPTTWGDVIPFSDYPYNPGMGLIKPDVVTPGHNVKSLRHDNNTGYISLSGTSMSAPSAAGVMALLLSKDPNLPPEKMGEIIQMTARPLSDSKDNVFGAGLVNAFEALKKIRYVEIGSVTINGIENYTPEYDETISISVRLLNDSDSVARDVVATLACEDEYVTILQDRGEYGDIDARDSKDNDANQYLVKIADNIPHAHKIDFVLTISTANEPYSWDDNFSVSVNAPQLTTLSPRVFDSAPGGNNNGVVDPGERVQVFLPVSNIGGSPAHPVTIDIAEGNNLITINEISDQFFSYVKDGETMYPSLDVSVSNEATYGAVLPFFYVFRTGSYIFIGQFSMIVGGTVDIKIGEGNDATAGSEPSPISVYFRSIRTQTVYTVEELNEAGAHGSLPLTRFGFFVTTSPPRHLPNFIIRMKHTQANDASRHDNGPFTTVYDPKNYSPTAGGWDLLELDRPFLWNGVDNILVDTAFAPVQGWDSSGQVRRIEAENGFRFGRDDNIDQTNIPTDQAIDYKPQAQMLFEITEGVDPSSPRSLSVALENEAIQLQWLAPADQRGREERRNRRGELTEKDSQDDIRNPDGYNVYRNGVKINRTLVRNTNYVDSNLTPSASYYYYVTSIYPESESRPSKIVSVMGIAPPQFDPPSGIKSKPFYLAISSLTDDTEIYYTLNGQIPSYNSFLYSDPILIEGDVEVKAIAYKEGYLPSLIITSEYRFLNQPQNVEAEPSLNFVYLSWEAPQRYDGEENGIRQSRNGYQRDTVNARTFIGYNLYRGFNDSVPEQINPFLIMDEQYFDPELAVGKYIYAITAVYNEGESEKTAPIEAWVGVAAPPVFSPEPGDYFEVIQVTAETLTEDATIRYTTDGSVPSSTSPVFPKEPIIVDKDITFRAIAIRSGWQYSQVVNAAYKIDTTDAEEEIAMPLVTELYNAYPNPFNPQTTIRFSLKEDDKASLKIYNIAGQLVSTLADERLASGEHSYIWPGLNNQGERMGSGIYFYRLQTSDYSGVKKIILLK